MLLQLVRNWLNAPVRKTPINSRRFRPRVETLEERITPVNNVQATFVPATGTLTITTVDQLTEAQILAGDNDQNFQVLAAGPGSVIVHKNGNTNINGGIIDVPFNNVINIVIDTKDGDDFVVLKAGVDIPGNVTFKGGDGNNSFNLDGDIAGHTKLKNLSITNGDGVDNIALLEGNFTISGTVTINTGDGGSNMNIGFQQADNVTIAGAINITAGTGADNVNFNGNDFLASSTLTVKGGSGDNSVRFAYQHTLVLTKAVTVFQGTGDDVFEVSNTNETSSFASITLNHGLGKNRVTFDSKKADLVAGNFIVNNSFGDDKFEVDSGTDFTVTGSLTLNNGSGDNITDITPAVNNTVGGAFKVTNGVGDDTTTIGGVVVTYKGVTMINGSGKTTTLLTGTNLTFNSVSVTNGDGLDTFTTTATNKLEIVNPAPLVVGGLTIKNGAGGSSTTIAATGAATVAIEGALSITNGDANDTTIIGNGAGNFNGLHSVTILNGGGNNNTTFNPTALTVTGSINVTNGDGFDQTKIGDGVTSTFNVTGNVKVTYATGGSNTFMNPLSGGSIGGTFTVTATEDNDKVDLIRVTINKATSLNLGAGNDEVEIDNSILAALTILTAGGDDIIEIEATTNDSASTTILGLFTVDMGSGKDTFDFGLDADDKVTSSSVKFNGGLGIEDKFDQNLGANIFGGTILNFEILLP